MTVQKVARKIFCPKTSLQLKILTQKEKRPKQRRKIESALFEIQTKSIRSSNKIAYKN